MQRSSSFTRLSPAAEVGHGPAVADTAGNADQAGPLAALLDLAAACRDLAERTYREAPPTAWSRRRQLHEQRGDLLARLDESLTAALRTGVAAGLPPADVEDRLVALRLACRAYLMWGWRYRGQAPPAVAHPTTEEEVAAEMRDLAAGTCQDPATPTPVQAQAEAERVALERALTGAAAGVQRLRVAVEARVAANRTPPPAAIVYRGERAYSVGERCEAVTEQEHAVLQPFLRCPALGERALIDGSGSERAARILAQLRERYGGLFAPYITCPRNRGEGGFKVKIVGTDGAKNAAAHPLRT